MVLSSINDQPNRTGFILWVLRQIVEKSTEETFLPTSNSSLLTRFTQAAHHTHAHHTRYPPIRTNLQSLFTGHSRYFVHCSHQLSQTDFLSKGCKVDKRHQGIRNDFYFYESFKRHVYSKPFSSGKSRCQWIATKLRHLEDRSFSQYASEWKWHTGLARPNSGVNYLQQDELDVLNKEAVQKQVGYKSQAQNIEFERPMPEW